MLDEGSNAKLSDEQLDKHRQISEKEFIKQRNSKKQDYLDVYEEKEQRFRDFMDRTDNVRTLSGDLFVRDPETTTPARHVTGPPVSQDDLNTFVGANITKRKNVPRDAADEGAAIIKDLIDPERFPWIPEERSPTTEERERAIISTTTLWAVKRTQTNRRNDPSQEQEAKILDALTDAGWTEKSVKKIQTVDQIENLPTGCVAHQVQVCNSESDIAVRLRDGRLLAIEAKVSNSTVNSIKRLIHEAGDKASSWRNEFGEQVIPAVVLSGVYGLKHLKEAQNERDMVIFWGHDMERLVKFADSIQMPSSTQ